MLTIKHQAFRIVARLAVGHLSSDFTVSSALTCPACPHIRLQFSEYGLVFGNPCKAPCLRPSILERLQTRVTEKVVGPFFLCCFCTRLSYRVACYARRRDQGIPMAWVWRGSDRTFMHARMLCSVCNFEVASIVGNVKVSRMLPRGRRKWRLL